MRARDSHEVCGPMRRWVESLAHGHVLDTRTWEEVNVRPFVQVNRPEDKS